MSLLLALFIVNVPLVSSLSSYAEKKSRLSSRSRPLQPPFPNGPCGGTLLTISSDFTFDVDSRLNGNRILLPPRDITVWLPPEYNDDEFTRFPTLYCHDGQNSISDEDSWTGSSWRLAGALTRLQERRLLKTPTPIVVMLPSCDEDLLPGIRRRHLEYGSISSVFAQAHADLVANTVKPLIDSTFRTDASNTCAIGSSLGGQASLHLCLRHPDLFGGAGLLSPAFGPDTLAAVTVSAVTRSLADKRIYLDIGGDHDEKKVPWIDIMDHLTPEHWWNPGYFWLDTSLQSTVESMRRALQLAGVQTAYHAVPGGRHNERAWSQRIHLPLLHLYGQ
jgi:hypothetical protein